MEKERKGLTVMKVIEAQILVINPVLIVNNIYVRIFFTILLQFVFLWRTHNSANLGIGSELRRQFFVTQNKVSLEKSAGRNVLFDPIS